MDILNILVLFFVVAVIWTLIKLAFKITAKVFSCGFLALVVIGILLLLGNVEISLF